MYPRVYLPALVNIFAICLRNCENIFDVRKQLIGKDAQKLLDGNALVRSRRRSTVQEDTLD